MRRTHICPKCGRKFFPEELQGLCPHCLRAMLVRLRAAKPRDKSGQRRPAPPQVPFPNKTESPRKPLFAFFVALAMTVPALHAQVVNDGATNTLSNVTNNSPTITVGTNGSFTLLVLSNNAVLNNTLNGVIGRNASAQSNEVRLVSATARWTMAAFSDLFIGSNGASSRLTVSGGALVQNAFNANIGHRSSSSNNSVLVTDAGSLWSSFLLNVGNAGAFNQLTVSNGATVSSGGGTVGFGPTASNNLATVTGAGSIWTNDGGLSVGSLSSGNLMIVSAGGRLANINGAVGQDSAATNNTVLVSDTGSSWTNLGILRVGDSGSGNRLVISNGSLVHSSGIGTVGLNSTAQSNSVTVADPGSSWAIGSDLYVGSNGSGNLLAISNGGFVVSSNAFLGASNSASGNSALVVGAGTLWSNRNDLVVGNSSIGNQVIVSNGAQVVARFTYAGYAGSSRSNLVFISGTGTVWSNDFSFYLGESGSANQLVVSNGALLTGSTGGIGSSASSSNNLAVVTGQGTRWNAIGGGMGVGLGGSGNRLVISSDATVFDFGGKIGAFAGSVNNEALVSDGHWSTDSLAIGESGARSRLIITNNGVVFSDRAIVVGSEASSTNNRVVVDGGSMRTVNGSGRLDVRRGTNVFNAGLIEANQLLLTNTQGFFEFNGGTLITRGATINNGVPFVVGRSGTTPAVWDVRAGATNHSLFTTLTVGESSSFNQLLVTNGALMTGNAAVVGANTAAKSNGVVVAGPGSRWEMNNLVLGSSGSFNQLVVSNGGWVSNYFNTLGSSSLAGNNTLLVTGVGSVFTNANSLTVGSPGSSNQLVVADGGTVRALAPTVCAFGSSNNLVLVTGSNALLHASFFTFGSDGPGNQLVVSNGGSLWGGSVNMGMNTRGSNNLAVVTGSGSVWTNANLNIGRNGKGNQVIVSNGGLMQGSAFIGFEAGCSNNVLLVTDSGSAVNGDLYAGFYAGRNQLVISNGATASGNYGVVGFQFTGTNNLATITGPGTTWSNALEFEVGLFSRDNRLVVSNGATLASGLGFIGYDFSANGNSAFVTDSGTRWLLSSNLYVGSNGSLSRLIITNGARVASRAGSIGAGSSSISNTVVVTGPGSVWTNSLELVLGQSGFGNQLVVSNGGSVVNGVGYLGIESSSSSNVVIVTGTGSAWTNRTSLSMGVLGNGNRLIVTNGGILRSGVCEIGSTGSSGNEVVITDAGSLWYVSSLLFAGSVGNGNRLILTNGGRVLSFGARIGYSGADNLTVLTGPGSGWTNFSGFLVGESGPRSVLILTNGGQILEAQGFITGVNPSSINNRVVVDGGTLRVQNLDGSAFEVRRGTNVLNSGLVEAARLLVTNAQGFFEFNGGTLSSENSQLSNGIAFRIGNGTSPATFILAGNGLHDFTGIPNATVSSNATLMGNGTIAGSVILSAGSTFTPGASIGQLTFSNSPSLHGRVVMEISKDPQGGITNDQIQAIGTLTYGGTLTVTNIGTNALGVGDRFQLFNAPGYAGFFSAAVSLPPLNAGLTWANRLFVDGSIEVIGLSFTQISASGNSLLLAGAGGTPGAPFAILTATNVTEPLSNWLSIVTNQFNPAGRFTFSNGITAGETQRFFRIRTP